MPKRNFVVWVFPNVSAAKSAATRESSPLRSAEKQWKKLTGQRVVLTGQVQRVLNVVVVRGNVQVPVRAINSALDDLTAG